MLASADQGVELLETNFTDRRLKLISTCDPFFLTRAKIFGSEKAFCNCLRSQCEIAGVDRCSPTLDRGAIHDIVFRVNYGVLAGLVFIRRIPSSTCENEASGGHSITTLQPVVG